jgi:hypothetical protein
MKPSAEISDGFKRALAVFAEQLRLLEGQRNVHSVSFTVYFDSGTIGKVRVTPTTEH